MKLIDADHVHGARADAWRARSPSPSATAAATVEVVVRDLRTAKAVTFQLRPGEYVVTAAAPLAIASEVAYSTGTVVVTMKREAVEGGAPG